MRSYISISIVVLFSLHFNVDILGVKATPYPVVISQPNGSKLTVKLEGDESFHYTTTVDGYLLVENGKGLLTYASVENGLIVSSNILASEINQRTSAEINFLKTLIPHLDMTVSTEKSRLNRSKGLFHSSKPMKVYPVTGSPKSLVILVNFADVQFTAVDSLAAFSNLLNQKGYSENGGTGSAMDYFHDASSGVFNPHFDVFGPVTLDNPMAYYGANDGFGNDVNPRQMIIEACTKASAAGLDFSQYDTDNDGFVDNVFVYYAGYNEAEGGSKNSIWPHKWRLSNLNTVFNGKIIFNYACTSELRGNSGTNMCGIGTFCHEFGHVLGLADYYTTVGTSHHTLSSWNIMDMGLYLNQGRTPPTYCAYDRYFLKWITPVQLTESGTYSLDTLASSNKAYLISQTPNRTQSLANNSVSPEFFTFENRQQKGWDTYLSGHGMIIYHINYNTATWASNGPNNDINAMGVDIIEADGIVSPTDSRFDPTLSGDPFPGTSNITSKKLSYSINPINTFASHTISNVCENNGIITFKLDSLKVDCTPKVTTTTPLSVTDIEAVIGGEVESEGTAAVSERGVCWSTNTNPTIANSKTSNGAGVGLFTDTITGLNVETTYHCRAYAINAIGTTYGSDIVFTTSSTTEFNLRKMGIFTIFPIPTNGLLTIKLDSGIHDKYSLLLFNSLGQKVFSSTNNISTTVELDLGKYCSAGIYWLKVVDINGESVGERRILFK